MLHVHPVDELMLWGHPAGVHGSSCDVERVPVLAGEGGHCIGGHPTTMHGREHGGVGCAGLSERAQRQACRGRGVV
jgi:hypothetical protein